MERGHRPAFQVRFRGFDRTEVIAALAKLASENDDARREIERLAAEIDRLHASLAEQRDNERQVHRTLVATATVAEEIRGRAEEEARQIRREAETEGEQMIARLRDQARGLEAEIDGLLARRREAEVSIASFIKSMSDELERVRQQSPGEPADGNGALAETG
jgi:cell division septum initiation protein DivIVA